MKNKMMKLLVELIKNSNRSDRKLAKVLGTSQPTVTRMRNKLLKKGYIQEFTVIPDFVKMGFEIVAVTLTKTKSDPELEKRARKSVMAKPNIIFCAGAEGMGRNGIMISFHKNYADYSKFITRYMVEWRDVIESYDTILISIPGTIIKPLSLKYLTELIEE
jgi:DNA-binding Lrp family transcriptional regulator